MRRFGGVAQRFPQPLYSVIDAVVEIHEGVGTPYPLTQLLARHYFARLFQQDLQDLKRLLLQGDLDSLPGQFSGFFIQFERPETNYPT